MSDFLRMTRHTVDLVRITVERQKLKADFSIGREYHVTFIVHQFVREDLSMSFFNAISTLITM